MRFLIACFILGLVACAYCQDDASAPLTQEDILEIIKEANPTLTCINWECRTNCLAAGNRAGYCAAGVCNCVPLVTA